MTLTAASCADCGGPADRITLFHITAGSYVWIPDCGGHGPRQTLTHLPASRSHVLSRLAAYLTSPGWDQRHISTKEIPWKGLLP